MDVFELVINGMEFAPGYTELTDPIIQRERLLEQAGEEIQAVDEDFLLALEHGMPPPRARRTRRGRRRNTACRPRAASVWGSTG